MVTAREPPDSSKFGRKEEKARHQLGGLQMSAQLRQLSCKASWPGRISAARAKGSERQSLRSTNHARSHPEERAEDDGLMRRSSQKGEPETVGCERDKHILRGEEEREGGELKTWRGKKLGRGGRARAGRRLA